EEAHYANGKLDGLYFAAAPDGKEIYYTYKNHIKEGPHQVYFSRPNGEKGLLLEANYQSGLLEGLLTEYLPDGKKVAETSYVSGKKHGIARLFSPQTGKLAGEIPFEEDRKEGLVVQY